MKKVFYLLFIIAAVVIAGCSNDSTKIKTQLEKSGITVQNIHINGNTATVKISRAGINATLHLKKVDGRWIGDSNKNMDSMKKDINKNMDFMKKGINKKMRNIFASNQSKIAGKVNGPLSDFDKIKQKHTSNIIKLRRLNYSLKTTLKTHLKTSRKVAEIKSKIVTQKNEVLKSLRKLKKLMISQIVINKSKKIVMEGKIKILQSKKQKLLQELKPNAPEVIAAIEEINKIKYDIAKLAEIREIYKHIPNYGSSLYGVTSDSVLFLRVNTFNRSYYYEKYDILTASFQGNFSKPPKNLTLASSYQENRGYVFSVQLDGFPLAAITTALDHRGSNSCQVQLVELATNNILRTLDYYFISCTKYSGNGNKNLPIAFSPDGKYLLCTTKYNSYSSSSGYKKYNVTLLYEVRNGKLICVFPVPSYKAIFFDGEYLITGSSLWYIKDLIPDFDSTLVAKLAETRRLKTIAEKPLKDYNDYMKQASRKRYMQAIELYKKALQIDLSKQKDATALTAQVHYKLAHCYNQKSFPKLALEQYNKILELYPKTQTQTLIVAQAHTAMGKIYYKDKQYTTALGHHQKSYNIYKALGNRKSRYCERMISRTQRKIEREAKKRKKRRH